MAPHSSTLAWKIPWMEEPGRLQSMGSLGVRHDWVTSLSLFTFMHWRRKWQPTPGFLPGESQGRGSLVGYRLWGLTESDTTEATQQQQQRRWEYFEYLAVALFLDLGEFRVYVCTCLLDNITQWSHPNSKLTQSFLSPAPYPSSNTFLCLCFHLSEWHRLSRLSNQCLQMTACISVSAFPPPSSLSADLVDSPAEPVSSPSAYPSSIVVARFRAPLASPLDYSCSLLTASTHWFWTLSLLLTKLQPD